MAQDETSIKRNVDAIRKAIPEYPNFLIMCAGEGIGFSYTETIKDGGVDDLVDVIYDALRETPEILTVFREVIKKIDTDKASLN